MRGPQVTIKDIAEIAGVSFSTVSRCLNGSPLVKDSTRIKVKRIADEMGFEFNSSARGLITSEVGTVGIVLPEQYTSLSVKVYHGMLMNSLRASIERADVDLIVTYQKNHYTKKNNIMRLVNRRKVDGLLLLVEDIEQETLDFLEDRNVPYVCAHYPPGKRIKDKDVIYTDHETGGKIVARHLLEKGRTKPVLLAVSGNHLEFKMRETGFINELNSSGYKIMDRFVCDNIFEDTYEIVTENIDVFRNADSIFALNDLMAFGAIKALREFGIRVPEDISVVGYDDSEYAKYHNPGLTTVHQPREELAMFSCERLFFQIEKKRAGEELTRRLINIQPVLVVRESS